MTAVVERKSRGSRFVAYALIGIMLTAMGYGMGVWSAPVTSFGIDGSGNLNVAGINANTLRVDALTSGRVPIAGAAGLLGDDGDLTWTGGDTLTVANVSTSSLYVNSNRVYPENPLAFTVWKDTSYFSRNEHTGVIASGANASTIILAAITAAPTGSTIAIKAGAYTIDTTITISKSVSLIGETGTVFTYTGAAQVIHLNATSSIRDMKIENLYIEANNKVGIQLSATTPNVISACEFNNLEIRNVTNGIYINGDTVYKNSFNNIIIGHFSTNGIYGFAGGYNSFNDIEITDMEADHVAAIHNNMGGSSFRDVTTGAAIINDGANTVWENIIIETIDGVSAPDSVAFRMAGNGNTIIGLTLNGVVNAKAEYGLSVYGTDTVIINYNTIGADFPNYFFSPDATSSGTLINANLVGGFASNLFSPASTLVNWNIIGGDVITAPMEVQTTTLAGGATAIATFPFRTTILLTGDGGANTVATITGGKAGQEIKLIFTDNKVTITDTDAHTANTVDLSAAFTSADDAVLTLTYDGTSWYEVSRSVN